MKRCFKNLMNQSKNPNGGSFLIFRKTGTRKFQRSLQTKNLQKQFVTHIFNFKSGLKILTPHVTRGKRQIKEINLRQS
jgi:hypothetical protein